MATDNRCTQHVKDPAGWKCRACEHLLCLKCAYRRPTNHGTEIICISCNGFADPILTRGEHPSLALLAPSAFAYPFSARGFAALGVWGAVFAALGLAGTPGQIASTVLFAGYLIAVVRTTALGEEELPHVRDLGPVLRIGAGYLRVLVASIAAAFPVLAYVGFFRKAGSLQSYFSDSIVYVTLIAGVLIAPLLCAGAAAGVPLLALLNPARALRSIARTAPDYSVTVGLFAFLGVLALVIEVLAQSLVHAVSIPIVPAAYAGAACAYLPLVSARVLGLFVLARGDELADGMFTGSMVPVLGGVLPPLEPGRASIPPTRRPVTQIPGMPAPEIVRIPSRPSIAPLPRINSRPDFERATAPAPVFPPRGTATNNPPVRAAQNVPGRATTPQMVPMRATTPSLQPMREATGPVRSPREATAPVRPMREATGPMRGLRETTPSIKPMRATTPSMQPVRATTPSLQPVRATTPSLQPVRATTPSMQPVRTTTPSMQPVRATTPAIQPIRGATSSTGNYSLPPMPSPAVRITTSLDIEITRPAGSTPWGASPAARETSMPTMPPLPEPAFPSEAPEEEERFEVVPIADAMRPGQIEGTADEQDFMPDGGALSIPPTSRNAIITRGVAYTPAMSAPVPAGAVSLPPPMPAGPSDDEVRAIADAGQFDRLADAYRARKGAVAILSADELWHVGMAARAKSDPQTASHALRRLGLDHPQSPQAPFALLEAGILLSGELKQTANAKRLFERVLQYYPDSTAATDATRLLRPES